MRLRMLRLLVPVTLVATLLQVQPAQAADDEVLILGATVDGGSSSLEAQAVSALGLTPVVVDDATWRGMSTAQFSQYRALVIGDTGGNSTDTFVAATDTSSVWGPAITANQLIIGTDPVGHAGSGGQQLVERGIAFASDVAGKTGLYVTFGDAYDGAAASTPVPLLDGIAPGGFTVQSAGCHDDVHIVAEHSAVSGLTDSTLSNWSCSVHDQFDRWPSRFQVLAIARNSGSAFTGPDGSVGVPYILAAGDGLKTFPLSAAPTYAKVAAGTPHTVTAELLDAQTRLPVQGTVVQAAVESGPGPVVVLSGLQCSTSLCRTDARGQVSFTYTSSVPRTDTVVVYRDANLNNQPDSGEEQVRVQVDWSAPPASVVPVLLIHGINPNSVSWDWARGTCDDFSNLENYLTSNGFGNRPILTLGYYSYDSSCDRDISGFTSPQTGNTYFDGVGAHSGPDGGHTAEAAIEHLGYHLAWFIYENYSKHGTHVDVVGHSMGGLIARFALGKVQAGAPQFPPALLIDDAVTLGSPHGGSALGRLLGRSCWQRQCSQMAPGDGFLRSLERDAWNPQGTGGTDWTAFGSDADRAVKADRAVGTNTRRTQNMFFGACHKVWYSNLGHEDYMEVGAVGRTAASFRVYADQDRCGAPLVAKAAQKSPVQQIATALNSKVA